MRKVKGRWRRWEDKGGEEGKSGLGAGVISEMLAVSPVDEDTATLGLADSHERLVEADLGDGTRYTPANTSTTSSSITTNRSSHLGIHKQTNAR